MPDGVIDETLKTAIELTVATTTFVAGFLSVRRYGQRDRVLEHEDRLVDRLDDAVANDRALSTEEVLRVAEGYREATHPDDVNTWTVRVVAAMGVLCVVLAFIAARSVGWSLRPTLTAAEPGSVGLVAMVLLEIMVVGLSLLDTYRIDEFLQQRADNNPLVGLERILRAGSEQGPETLMALCSRVIARVPRWPWPYYSRSLCHLRLDEPDSAYVDMQAALHLAPRNPQFLKGLAKVQVARHRFPAAVEALQASLKEHAEQLDAYVLLAWVQFNIADYEAVIAVCDAALGRRWPERLGPALSGRVGDEPTFVAFEHTMARLSDGATLATGREGMELFDDVFAGLGHHEQQDLLIRLQLLRGLSTHIRFGASRPEDWTAALERRRDGAALLFYRGCAYAAEGATREAVADFERALPLGQADAGLRLQLLTALGRIHLDAGDCDRAVRHLNQALAAPGPSGGALLAAHVHRREALHLRARAQCRRGDWPAAQRDYSELLRLRVLVEPDMVVGRGVARSANGDREGAVADFRSVRRRTNEPDALFDRVVRDLGAERLEGVVGDWRSAQALT